MEHFLSSADNQWITEKETSTLMDLSDEVQVNKTWLKVRKDYLYLKKK